MPSWKVRLLSGEWHPSITKGGRRRTGSFVSGHWNMSNDREKDSGTRAPKSESGDFLSEFAALVELTEQSVNDKPKSDADPIKEGIRPVRMPNMSQRKRSWWNRHFAHSSLDPVAAAGIFFLLLTVGFATAIQLRSGGEERERAASTQQLAYDMMDAISEASGTLEASEDWRDAANVPEGAVEPDVFVDFSNGSEESEESKESVQGKLSEDVEPSPLDVNEDRSFSIVSWSREQEVDETFSGWEGDRVYGFSELVAGGVGPSSRSLSWSTWSSATPLRWVADPELGCVECSTGYSTTSRSVQQLCSPATYPDYLL